MLLKHSTQVTQPLAFVSLSEQKLTLSLTAIATTSNVAIESQEEHVYSKAEGKKRALDEDEEATATEGETSTQVLSLLKKKKKHNK